MDLCNARYGGKTTVFFLNHPPPPQISPLPPPAPLPLSPADLAADLPADDSAHDTPDHASLDATFHALVFLGLFLRRDLRRLLLDLRNLLRLDHGCRRHLRDRKSTRLNSSHGYISYAVFC